MQLDNMIFIRVFTSAICILICAIGNAQNDYFVNAKSGLNVRSSNKLSAKKVAKIPYGVTVEKIADTDKEMTIIDNGVEITGKWVKIKYSNYPYIIFKETDTYEKEGYVFDGYLQAFKNKNAISISTINEAQYNDLKKKVLKETEKPIKINDLDSVKVLLKNRVEWVTQFEKEEDKREDQIKSITIDNGQKLVMYKNYSEDFYFRNAACYYPEYGILVLDAGHSSDMSFSIKTGETYITAGNPEYIHHSPRKNYRLNGSYDGQECINYFFQKKINGEFVYLADFYWDYETCYFNEFYWISETVFIYRNARALGLHTMPGYFKGHIKLN
ncbi:SH3 domain-containing protein [Aquimarina litoralis]|uniref:SH3 domain-containing protein n=1 Tax=Aquimarina litoralis TaxID=584605 RepID=UPI001C572859|nr:SH3 domain-containing protein [Aquimarina litoralis]MBW1294163.1 SH3 domain-containing protein [Aquimarina litoralis]